MLIPNVPEGSRKSSPSRARSRPRAHLAFVFLVFRWHPRKPSAGSDATSSFAAGSPDRAAHRPKAGLPTARGPSAGPESARPHAPLSPHPTPRSHCPTALRKHLLLVFLPPWHCARRHSVWTVSAQCTMNLPDRDLPRFAFFLGMPLSKNHIFQHAIGWDT